jgi:hypothetical protein
MQLKKKDKSCRQNIKSSALIGKLEILFEKHLEYNQKFANSKHYVC